MDGQEYIGDDWKLAYLDKCNQKEKQNNFGNFIVPHMILNALIQQG
ncbi:hypothetical protein BH09DEP1_BH09DEP1_3790 [soil metagenome]